MLIEGEPQNMCNLMCKRKHRYLFKIFQNIQIISDDTKNNATKGTSDFGLFTLINNFILLFFLRCKEILFLLNYFLIFWFHEICISKVFF